MLDYPDKIGKNGLSLLWLHYTKKWSFLLRISSFTEEILNGKLHFLCSANVYEDFWNIITDIFYRLENMRKSKYKNNLSKIS